jgi:hypothetical protein
MADRPAQASLVRCVFGSPFRPAPAVDPAWLAWNGGTAARLAAAIYEERSFADLPILAEAAATSPSWRTAGAAATDRAYWEKRATKEALQATDALLKLVNEVVPKAEPRYVKNIIGIQVDGSPRYFPVFVPRKAGVIMQIKLPHTEEADKQIEDARIETTPYNAKQTKVYELRISGPVDDKQRAVLLGLIRKASEAYGKA